MQLQSLSKAKTKSSEGKAKSELKVTGLQIKVACVSGVCLVAEAQRNYLGSKKGSWAFQMKDHFV